MVIRFSYRFLLRFFLLLAIEGWHWHRLAVRIGGGGMSMIERKKVTDSSVRTSLVNLDEFMRIHKGYMFIQSLVAFVSYEDDAHIRWDLNGWFRHWIFFFRTSFFDSIAHAVFQLLINHRPLLVIPVRRRKKIIQIFQSFRSFSFFFYLRKNPSPKTTKLFPFWLLSNRSDKIYHAILSNDKTTTAGGRKLFIEAIIEAISDHDTLNFAPCRPVYHQTVLNYYPIHVTLTR